jgi:hypothetical protein
MSINKYNDQGKDKGTWFEIKLESLKQESIIKYSGKTEDFLSEQRNCRNIHFHDTMGFQARLHMKSCSFESPKQ